MSVSPLYDFLYKQQEEFNGFMLGDNLGEGFFRVTYEAPWAPKKFVIKIEKHNDSREFCNVTEWNVWSILQKTEAGKWLAPCRAISRSGNFLIQRRTQPLKDPKKQIPNKIPYFLADTHVDNWGIYKGRAVLHDYGFLNSILKPISRAKKLKMVPRSKS